ncbi:MAG: DUF3450 domain-containing protein [Verrucomicrobia bacterium]|nr:DUF3450 domain-containing protein [Verrucomicrobiota bacterium]
MAARLPEDPAATRLSYSQRLQTVVGLLAQIDRFNTDLRSVTEIKTLEDGSHEVQTLYFGLSSALFSNPSGTYAGFGKAGPSGWEWTTVSGRDADNIAAAIDIYSARRAPIFVTVPIAVD